MKVLCTFDYFTYAFMHGKFYGCSIKNQQIPENEVLEFIGNHEVGKTNDDVTDVQFCIRTVKKVPQGLTKTFPNMKILSFYYSELKKLTKADMVEYKHLERFLCGGNQIEFLPGDLFEDFKNLEFISLCGNKLQVIEPNLLDGLDKLEYVDLRGNPNYDKCYSIYPEHLYFQNATLQEVKNHLNEKFFASTSQNVKNYVKNIQQKAHKLRISESKLAREVEELRNSEKKLIENFTEMSEENSKLKSNDQELSQHLQKIEEENQKLKDENQKLSKQVEKWNNNSMLSDLSNHIQDENFKDFKIDIVDREFYVHKLLLTIRSPTFAEMLRYNPEAENLKLIDISVEIFEIILNFLYTDELPCEDGTNFLHVFAAASRLKIEKLRNFAAMKVLDQVNAENALDVLDMGNKYKHDELRQKAFEEILKSYPKIKFSEECANETEKVKKMVEYFKKMEAMELELSNLMN